MMRIICPNCGDEPKKGQRHICAPMAVPTIAATIADEPSFREEPGSGVGVLHRRGLKATPNAVCNSITSLIQKSPGLWRSTGALARCGGEAFVAGLLATAIRSHTWNKDPKGALISALTGRVADEAAQAIQHCWRRRCSARAPQRPVKRDGFQQLSLKQHSRCATAETPPQQAQTGDLPRPRLSMSRERMSSRGSDGGTRARPPPLSVCPALPQSTSVKTEVLTPRNKSNPRPHSLRSVPMNPIQALKQRKAQQEKETDEQRQNQLLEAEERRLARAQGGSGSVPASPQSVKPYFGLADDSMPSSADTAAYDGNRMLCGRPLSGQSTPHFIHDCFDEFASAEQDFYQEAAVGAGVSATAVAAALTPFERRAARQGLPSPRAPMNSGSKPPVPVSSGGNSGMASTARRAQPQLEENYNSEFQIQSAPTTLQHWRPNSSIPEAGPETPRASSANSPNRPSLPRGEPSATARLRERMRQREGGAAIRDKSPARVAPVGTSGWQERIELRQREVDEQQEIETQHRIQTEERSSRRNDALRKVMERQAERQEAVEGLEVGLQALEACH